MTILGGFVGWAALLAAGCGGITPPARSSLAVGAASDIGAGGAVGGLLGRALFATGSSSRFGLEAGQSFSTDGQQGTWLGLAARFDTGSTPGAVWSIDLGLGKWFELGGPDSGIFGALFRVGPSVSVPIGNDFSWDTGARVGFWPLAILAPAVLPYTLELQVDSGLAVRF